MAASTEAMRRRLQDRLLKKTHAKGHVIEDLNAQANMAYVAKKFTAAIIFLDKVIVAAKNLQTQQHEKQSIRINLEQIFVYTYHALGKCYFNLNNFKKAIKYFQLVEKNDPKYAPHERAFYLGTMLLKKDGIDAARQQLETAIANPDQNNPCCLDAYLNLATLLKHLEPTADMNKLIIAYYLKAAKNNPAKAHLNLGSFYYDRLNNIENAIYYLKLTIKECQATCAEDLLIQKEALKKLAEIEQQTAEMPTAGPAESAASVAAATAAVEATRKIPAPLVFSLLSTKSAEDNDETPLDTDKPASSKKSDRKVATPTARAQTPPI